MKNSVWNAVEERFQKYAKGERKKGAWEKMEEK